MKQSLASLKHKSEYHLLLYLCDLGAFRKFVKTTTVSLSKDLGLPQQTVSRWLRRLEADGFIFKTRQGFKLTSNGKEHLKKIHESLKPLFEESATVSLEGDVFEGFGEASYYMALQKYLDQFEKALGFAPFPGTLNLRVHTSDDAAVLMNLSTGVCVDGFEHEGRRLGNVKCFPCTINEKVDGAIIIPDRSHYDRNIVQVIAPVNLRKDLNLKNGSHLFLELKE